MAKNMLICIPDTPGVVSIPGSESVTADCGHAVWISLEGAEMVRAGDVLTSCMTCAMKTAPQVKSVSVVPGALNAIEEHFGDDAAADAARMMAMLGLVERGLRNES